MRLRITEMGRDVGPLCRSGCRSQGCDGQDHLCSCNIIMNVTALYYSTWIQKVNYYTKLAALSQLKHEQSTHARSHTEVSER